MSLLRLSRSLVLAAGPLAAGLRAARAPSEPEAFAERVRPFLAAHCLECHAAEDPQEGFRLDLFADAAAARADRSAWERVRERLALGEMPPKRSPRPPVEDVAEVIAWIDATFGAPSSVNTAGPADPGRVTLRRLNRVEYANTVRDLVGVAYDAQAELPADDVGYGFDNIGDVLSLSDVLMEKYLAAAERIAEEALSVVDPENPPVERAGPDQLTGKGRGRPGGRSRALSTEGEIGAVFAFEHPGTYRLRVRAFQQAAGDEPARMALRLDRRELARHDVTGLARAAQEFEHELVVAAGEKRFEVAFLNDLFLEEEPDPERRDRNLHVEWLEVVGPLDPPPPNRFQREMLDDLAPETLRAKVRTLARRAWRRGVMPADVDRLLALVPPGAEPRAALRLVIEALLVSPRFLFRVEADGPRAAGGGDATAEAVRGLDGWELATRLSYFLWSSMPDERLFELAIGDRLCDPAVLRAEVARMLADARSSALGLNFAEQWLQVRELDRAVPDPARFPGFDAELRASMRAETRLFLEAIVRERRSLWEILDADFTFVDERLARHYGIEGIRGGAMRRVALDDGRRGGILGHASVLTVTSNPTRTSPVKRGKWLLETLLDAPPPAPPPGVGVLEDGPEAARAASLRERLAAHRAQASCAVCHDTIDPLGFGLENYDAIGGWRARDEGFAVDAHGTLPDGGGFDGPVELKRRLVGRPEFLRGLTKSLATYALGRGIERGDQAAVDAIVARLAASAKPTFDDLVAEIVGLDAFSKRRTERRAE